MKKLALFLALNLCIACGGSKNNAVIDKVTSDDGSNNSTLKNAVNLFTTCEVLETQHPNTDIDKIINLDLENNPWRSGKEIDAQISQYIMNLYRSVSEESFDKDAPIKVKDAKLKVDKYKNSYLFVQVGQDTEQEKYEFLILQDVNKHLVHFNFAFKADTECLDTQRSLEEQELSIQISYSEKYDLLVAQQKTLQESEENLKETEDQTEKDRLNKSIEETKTAINQTMSELQEIRQTANEMGILVSRKLVPEKG